MYFQGTPTPVFYEIVLVLIITMVIVAIGLNALLAFILSMLVSYALFIAAVGGFKSSEAFVMGAGWGILIMIPVFFGAAIAAAVGALLRGALNRRKKKSEE